jgi:hypothetical protein
MQPSGKGAASGCCCFKHGIHAGGQLRLSKADGVCYAAEGKLTCDVTVNNTGSVTLDSFQLLEGGATTAVSCTPAVPAAAIAPGATATCSMRVSVDTSTNFTGGTVALDLSKRTVTPAGKERNIAAGCTPANSANVLLHKVVGWVPPPAITAQIVNSTCAVPRQAGEAKTLRILQLGIVFAVLQVCQWGCRAGVMTNGII